ncbi:MAG: hypothetical protein BWY52_02823 [Chloroflexi bacterium ADurb.Bin325]|nr:MAG: hypothetical protein BWY52_02823 [Chloroflexi bacterium ADurb.Bin325]
MFQHARPRDGALLGDVADEEEREAARLGKAQQVRRAVAHLGDAARAGSDGVGVDALHGIHHDQPRRGVLDLGRDGLEVRLGQHEDIALDDAQPLRAQLDLRGGFLAGDVEDRALAAAQRMAQLDQQGGLADAGVAADEHHRAGHDAAAQHAAQLADRHRDALIAVGGDVGQGQRRAAGRQRGAGRPARRRLLHGHLDQRVPLAAIGAAPHPLALRAAACLTDVSGPRLCHGRLDSLRCSVLYVERGRKSKRARGACLAPVAPLQ